MTRTLVVPILPDRIGGSIVDAIDEVAAGLGYAVRRHHPRDRAEGDVALMVGPPVHYPPDRWKGRRILWFGEPLPGPDETATRSLGLIPHGVRRTLAPLRHLPVPEPVARARASALVARERAANLRAVVRLAPHVDVVATTSRDGAASLARAGVRARVVPFGYHPRFAGPLVDPAAERDLSIVVLGSLARATYSRRARVLRAVELDLGPSFRPLVVDGVWGPERDRLLGRSRIVLDIHRAPGNFDGLRVAMALAAGAVPVGEPMRDPWPFVPDVHLVHAPSRELARAAIDLLRDEARRADIVRAGQALLRNELDFRRSVTAILAA